METVLKYVPSEWAPQRAIWVGWPHLRGEWGDTFERAREEITGFVRALCKATPVRIACGSREAYSSAWFAVEPEIKGQRVSLHTLSAGDIWLRDTGPVFAQRNGALIAMDFRFNGWGGKYVMPGDTMTAGGIASVERVARQRFDFVLEGGAVDVDGAGRLLTTRQCLLNPNRNPGWTQAVVEQSLKQAFQVDDIVWLADGLRNDHTDGHIDNIARFIGYGRVLCQTPSGNDDPNADTYAAIHSDLETAGLEIITVPSPGRIETEHGETMPASHLNFLISNGHVFLPVYESVFSEQALTAMRRALPDYTIIGLPARNILSGGGAFHCMTQQVPALMEGGI
ncbi:MAG: agmatine deiminase family protein [Pseudomonadota bacterium]